MNNTAISETFKNIADLLELKNESSFKVRAYQRAARSIEHLPVSIDDIAEQGKLEDIQGVGQSLAEKILELLRTGRCDYYEELRASFPEAVFTLSEIPTVGTKTALRLVNELDIGNMQELEQALLDGRVAALPRLGQKSADNILRNLQALRTKDRRINLGLAISLAEEVIEALSGVSGVHNLTAAGSLRRWKETVGDIDLMGTASDPERVTNAFASLPCVREVLALGPTKASVLVGGDLQVDLRIVEDERFGSLLQHFTGSKEHNVALRERALRQGLKLSEYGISPRDKDEPEAFTTEEPFYERLGLPWIPPELRENLGEIEAAEQGKLPNLIELTDIKGDLHTHTNWSDGHRAIEEMARAARELGYEYLIISDHSGGRGIAHGLSVERLREQMAEIQRVNKSLDGIALLTGSEVDVRADGSMDFPDDVLADLDVVIASVHSAMGQDEAKMTGRIISAMRNPHVDIIGHLTCRLLGKREPVSLDIEAILQAAKETGTTLEINADPHRLDLKDTHVKRARELGVKIVISTDAHAIDQLDVMRFGVSVARRGWCEAGDILNTRPLSEIKALLKKAS